MPDFPCREYGHFDCAEREGGPCTAERAAMAMAHENHERFEDGCPECDAYFAEMRARYGQAASREMSRAEREEMEADRELMRDEYHVL